MHLSWSLNGSVRCFSNIEKEERVPRQRSLMQREGLLKKRIWFSAPGVSGRKGQQGGRDATAKAKEGNAKCAGASTRGGRRVTWPEGRNVRKKTTVKQLARRI